MTESKPKYPSETFSSLEEDKLKEFRLKISESNLVLTDELHEDAHLIRWLRARNLDVKKAYNMLKTSLEWRKEHKLDGILEREFLPEDVMQQTCFANLGVDKDGYPVFLTPMGRQDYRSLLEKYGFDECFRYQLINCEKLMLCLKNISEEQGRPVTQLVNIIDLEGYSYRQLTSKLCRDFMAKGQTIADCNYPEVLHYAVIINAPKIFYILYNFLKPFIPKHTLEKVDIYGPEPEKWKKAIAEKIPMENIPPHWGGTLKGSDEYCSKDTVVWPSGPMPLSFFSNDKSPDIDESLTTATINARDSLQIFISVTKPMSSIAWRVHIQNHDIGFKILCDDDGSEILSYRRIPSQKQVLEGNLSCDKAGNYTAVFDNTYSYTRSKTIHYEVSIVGEEKQITTKS